MRSGQINTRDRKKYETVVQFWAEWPDCPREVPLSIETSAGPSAERLKQAAFDLACEQGLAALSARALALQTGGSASAINYHFGSRDKLLLALHGEAAERSAKAREAALECGYAMVPDWADWPYVFAAVLQARLERERAANLLLLELEHESNSGREPGLREAALGEAHIEARFWFEFASRFGASEAAARVWADFALGLTGLLIGETEAVACAAWIAAPAVRLQQRLGRQPVALVERRKPAMADRERAALDEARTVTGSARASRTTQAILDAAMTTIAKQGADRLTQREVATLAGVSLASVTYFFRTRNDLIYAAFDALCQRMRARVDALERRAADEFVEANVLLQKGDGLESLAALNALLRAAARDAALAPIAAEIRQLRGIGSFVMLGKLGLRTDWVDAYVWGVLAAGSTRTCLLAHPHDPVAAIEAAAGETLLAVFGVRG
ncbi:TetR family transcriptional regulator [Paraburkholderia sp. Ac-20336]|uniref:TetR family transcriptional regulator n=1 Tax=Paraburkholderia sp. Ac-20336 TaxID=2703886 RepID=UPI00197F6565|nr:TetR family transcriptional regulator [Paraburkholderia sp. Ac-20336]